MHLRRAPLTAGPCAVLQIFKQARNGSITLVKVPHTEATTTCSPRSAPGC